MKKDTAHILRKTLVIITMILIFTTVGLFMISMNLKEITLDYYGDVKNIKTMSNTVGGFLLQNQIHVNDSTKVEPSSDTQITNGMQVKIYSENELAKINIEEIKDEYNPVVAKIEEVVESIPFEEERKDNPKMDRGTTNTLQDGKEGQKSTKYLVKYNRNEEIYRAKLSTDILSEAINKVVEVGTKLNLTASRSALVQSIGATQVDSGFKKYNIKLPVEQQEYAYNVCKKYGVQYELFLAIMYKESGFNPNAVGGGNSYGLCQIHVSNFSNLRSRLGVSSFTDPYDNMTAGAYLLSIYFGSARKVVSGTDSVEAYALNSYNMGEGVFFRNCYSQGVLHRGYSNSVRSIRNSLIANGGI